MPPITSNVLGALATSSPLNTSVSVHLPRVQLRLCDAALATATSAYSASASVTALSVGPANAESFRRSAPLRQAAASTDAAECSVVEGTVLDGNITVALR